MILSVSRRTDIPAFYFPWFLNRLKAGEVLVRNPMNPVRVSRVSLSPSTVDCLVFWTKNPTPMLDRLRELEPYPWYIQFTITPYGPELETALPRKAVLLDTFRKLADVAGPERVVWRYSPVFLNDDYPESLHAEFFAQTARVLKGYTEQCKFSFLDMYPKIAKRMNSFNVTTVTLDAQRRMAETFQNIATAEGLTLGVCGETNPELLKLAPARCIDPDLIERLTGRVVPRKKDSGQRPTCWCPPSVDIGAYQTCLNGCVYCYANQSAAAARSGHAEHDPESPFLRGNLQPGDQVSERKMNRLPPKTVWPSLF